MSLLNRITIIYTVSAVLILGSISCSLGRGLDPDTPDEAAAEQEFRIEGEESSAENELAQIEEPIEIKPPILQSGYLLELAIPSVTGSSLNRAVYDNISEWPDMLYLNESAGIGKDKNALVSITPVDVRIVNGRKVPVNYNPVDDIIKTEPAVLSRQLRGFYGKPIVFIPPNTSLVMVRIETNPSIGRWVGQDEYPGTTAGPTFECPDVQIDYSYDPNKFRISYPEVGEARVFVDIDGEYWLDDFQPVGWWSPSGTCPASGWLYSYLPTLTLDPNQLWLEYVGGTQKNQLAFWTLTTRP